MSRIIQPQTARLKLRQWRPADRAPFAELNSHPEVMAFFPKPQSRFESDAMADKCEALIAERGWGFWAAEIKATEEFIGFLGLNIPSTYLPFSPCENIAYTVFHGRTGRKEGMKTEVLKAFIQKVWNEGNIDAIPEFIADKYTVIHDPGDPWEGMELDVAGFQNRVSTSRAPVPDQYFDIQELYERENSVCITWLWSGTHLGEIAGIPPSGKKLHMSGATVYYFDNSRITGHWQIADRLGLFQQMQANQA